MSLKLIVGQQVVTESVNYTGGTPVSFSMRIRLNTLIPDPTQVFIFFGAAFNPWSFNQFYGTTNQLTMMQVGSAGGQDINVTTVAGTTYHLAMVWDNGDQRYYVNGSLVNTGTQSGYLLSFTGPLQFGGEFTGVSDSGKAGEVEVSDLLFWNNHALTGSEVLGLRGATTAPSSIGSSGPFCYFPLTGPVGTSPTGSSDTHLADSAGHVTIASITGSPIFTNPLVYIPPVTSIPYLCPSGKTLYFLFTNTADNPSSNGGPYQAGPTLNNAPSISVNGGSEVMLSALAPLAFDNYLAFLLPTPLGSSDTMTVTAAEGFVTTTDGECAELLAVAATRLAPIAAPSGDPTTMAIGWNAPHANSSVPTPLFSNLVRCGSGWTALGGTFTADANDHLTVLDGTVSVQVLGVTYANGTSKPGYPTQTGNWTLKWSSTTITSIELLDRNGLATVTQVGTDSTTEGVTTRVYSVTPPSSNYGATLYIEVVQGGGSCDLSNLALYPPGEPTDGSETFNTALIQQAYKPATIRHMDNCGTNSSNITAYSQWTSTSKMFASVGPDPTVIPISQVGPYTDSGNFFYGPPHQYLMECTTPSPHGLVDGNTVTIRGSDLNSLNVGGDAPYSANGVYTLVRVTSDTTFVIWYDTPTGDWTPITVSVASATLAVTAPVAVGHIMALATRTGSDPWINVPHAMPDDEVANFAADVAAQLPVGKKVYVERSNETWNYALAFQQSFYDYGMASVAGIDAATYHALRTSAIHDIFETALATVDRGNDLVRVLGSFFGSVGRTETMVSWYVTNGKSFDALAIAPYFDVGPTGDAYINYWSATDIDGVFDAAGLYLTHNTNYTQAVANHGAAISSIMGAKVVAYEGSIEQGCSQGTNYAAKSRAFSLNPQVATFATKYLRQFEASGMTLFNWFSEDVPFGSTNAVDYSLCYNPYFGPDTLPGVGDGSDSKYDNRDGFDLTQNVSVIGHTLNGWMDALTNTTPTPTPTPTTVSAWAQIRAGSNGDALVSYKPGDTYYGTFVVYDPATGALADASSTPTSAVTHNGTVDGSVTPTVSHARTGTYETSFLIPSGYHAGDSVQISWQGPIIPTGGSMAITTGGVIASIVLDGLRVSDLPTPASTSAIAAAVALVIGVPVVVATTQGVSTSSTFTGDSSLSSQDGTYAGKIAIINAVGSPNIHGAVATVTAYTGSSRYFTLSPSFPYGIIPPAGTTILLV